MNIEEYTKNLFKELVNKSYKLPFDDEDGEVDTISTFRGGEWISVRADSDGKRFIEIPIDRMVQILEQLPKNFR